MLEQKVLYNVLKAISKGDDGLQQAPDKTYLESLENIGLIKILWDTTLTDFGKEQLKYLENKLIQW